MSNDPNADRTRYYISIEWDTYHPTDFTRTVRTHTRWSVGDAITPDDGYGNAYGHVALVEMSA